MDIAALNVRITIQKSTAVVDKVGNHISAWQDYYSCHATLGGENGNQTETSAAGQIVDHADATFTVRFCNALLDVTTEGYRIRFGSSIYNIRTIDHMNFKKKGLKFYCEKVRR